GDSRLYYFQGGRIDFQTKDHSVPQAMADAGDISGADIRHHADRNRLLRALGMEQELRPSVGADKRRLYREDAFLLCVDGFWDDIEDAEMEADLAKASDPGAWLATMESRILRRAEEGHDNYTAISIFFDNACAPEPPHPRLGGRKRSRGQDPSVAHPGRTILPGKLVRIAGITAIILALFTLAAVVTRKYIEQRTTIVVSRSPIKRLNLPGTWTEVQIASGAEHGPAQHMEYGLSTEREVRIHIEDRVEASAGSPAAEGLGGM